MSLCVYSPQCAENTKFLVRASYLEIYNEDVRDLLGADTKQKLEVGADRPSLGRRQPPLEMQGAQPVGAGAGPEHSGDSGTSVQERG